MGRREQQHLGRSTDDSRDLAGRDRQEDPGEHEETSVGDSISHDVEADDSVAQAEAAKDISRALDREEGYDRAEPRGRTSRNGEPGRPA